MRNRLELKKTPAGLDVFAAPLELKLSDTGAGTFEGYGAVFGNIDSHGDIIAHGAFAKTLAEHKSAGTMPAMYVEHGPALGGDALPAGVYTDISEDTTGLRVKGRLSALDTDYTKRIRGLMQDGALAGMSIGYRATETETKALPSGARRRLKAVHLSEISLVTTPSNGLARVEAIKAAGDFEPDTDTAAKHLGDAILMHDRRMSGSYYGDSGAKDMAVQMDLLRNAHEALTGSRNPDGLVGWKSGLTVRELERMLRDEARLSGSEAKAVASLLAKSMPRDEVGQDDGEESALAGVVSGFSLPAW